MLNKSLLSVIILVTIALAATQCSKKDQAQPEFNFVSKDKIVGLWTGYLIPRNNISLVNDTFTMKIRQDDSLEIVKVTNRNGMPLKTYFFKPKTDDVLFIFPMIAFSPNHTFSFNAIANNSYTKMKCFVTLGQVDSIALIKQ